MSENNRMPVLTTEQLVLSVGRDLSQITHASVLLVVNLANPGVDAKRDDHAMEINAIVNGCPGCIIAGLSALILKRLRAEGREALIARLQRDNAAMKLIEFPTEGTRIN
jgi:hypothetical protein